MLLGMPIADAAVLQLVKFKKNVFRFPETAQN
jgi:hypothetical protein